MSIGSRNVLVAGGAGFVGSHLVDTLLATGDSVTVIDNLLTGSIYNLESALKNTNFEFIEANINDHNVEAFARKFDVVFHLASPASPVDYLKNPLETLKSGSIGTLNLCELAKKSNARLILASTSEVYGDPLVNPQPETYWGNVNPIGPRSVYDEAKRFSEAVVASYFREFGSNFGIVRIFNTYGPRMAFMDGRAVPNFTLQALQGLPLTIYGNGHQTRSLCYVEDLVAALIRFSQVNHRGPVNLGNPHEITMIELAKKIIEVAGSNSILKYEAEVEDDPKVRCPDIEMAGKLIDWTPSWDLDQGLKATVTWYRERLKSLGTTNAGSKN